MGLGRVIVDRETIRAMVRRLAAEIEDDLELRRPRREAAATPTAQGASSGGQAPVFIGVLKGCVYFFTDLTRHLDWPIEVDFIQVRSYGASTTSSGSVTLVKDISIDVRDRDVYLVEDIVDTGYTLCDLVDLIRARHPRSVQVVALLSKPSRREIDVDVAFLGTEVDDLFVVGYGLDHAERYRNLPDIHELVPEG